MTENQPIIPDLRTLGRILAPASREATTSRRNPETGEPTILMKKVGLTLPEDFVMTDFDVFVLNHLHSSANMAQIASLVESEFTKRGIYKLGVDKDTFYNYFGVLRGKDGRRDRSKAPLCGSFPLIRTRYNAMRMLETNEFPDYKRDLQYITAISLTRGERANKLAAAWKITSPAEIIDMMMLDLSEITSDELNLVAEECVDDYSAMYPKGTSHEKWLEDFKAGFILQKPPRCVWGRFDQLVNQSVSALWLDKLNSEPTIFRAENMEYIRKTLEIFVRGFDDGREKRHSEMQLVNTWMQNTYRASAHNMGTSIVRINTGLNWDGEAVVDLIDRGFEYIRRKLS